MNFLIRTNTVNERIRLIEFLKDNHKTLCGKNRIKLRTIKKLLKSDCDRLITFKVSSNGVSVVENTSYIFAKNKIDWSLFDSFDKFYNKYMKIS